MYYIKSLGVSSNTTEYTFNHPQEQPSQPREQKMPSTAKAKRNDNNNINGIVGQRIAERRKQLGISQEVLSRIMGYSDRSAICRIEKGKNILNQTKISKFAEVLCCSEAYLMGWTDNLHYPVDAVNPVIRDFYTETYREFNQPDKLDEKGIKLFKALDTAEKKRLIKYMYSYLTSRVTDDSEEMDIKEIESLISSLSKKKSE